MQTVDDIRRERLLQLIAEHGTQSALSKAINKSPAQISQWVNRSPNSKTGKPRVMDSATAREVELACGKLPGWMDQPIQQGQPTVMVAQEPPKTMSEPVAARIARDITTLMRGLDPLVVVSAKDVIRKLLDGDYDEAQTVNALMRLQAMSAAAAPIKRTGTG